MYDLTATAQVFKSYSVGGVVVDATVRVQRDIIVEVGSFQETVNVQATQAQLQTTEGALPSGIMLPSVIITQQIQTAVVLAGEFLNALNHTN